jgi:hypothetical protein
VFVRDGLMVTVRVGGFGVWVGAEVGATVGKESDFERGVRVGGMGVLDEVAVSDGTAVKVDVEVSVRVSVGVEINPAPSNAPTVNAAAVFMLARARSIMLTS